MNETRWRLLMQLQQAQSRQRGEGKGVSELSLDRVGMRDDLEKMAEQADKFRLERLFIVTDCHDFYYFAQACRAFSRELKQR